MLPACNNEINTVAITDMYMFNISTTLEFVPYRNHENIGLAINDTIILYKSRLEHSLLQQNAISQLTDLAAAADRCMKMLRDSVVLQRTQTLRGCCT